jgi:adenylylsulfate kinase
MKQANRERGVVIWFTGLSGSGKTTIAHLLEEKLLTAGVPVELLDGDVVRENLSKGLGFSKEDRDTNIRRIAFVAHLLQRNGVFVITAAISPYRAIREEARAMVKDFIEVYANAPLDVCEERDVKGLYAKARAGEIKGFTGVDDPYEPPSGPEVECRTDQESVEESAQKVIDKLVELKYLDR